MKKVVLILFALIALTGFSQKIKIKVVHLLKKSKHYQVLLTISTLKAKMFDNCLIDLFFLTFS